MAPPSPDRSQSRLRPVARWATALAALIALQLIAAAAPPWTESAYSQGVFPWVRRALAAVTGPAPFSLAQVGLALLLVWLAFHAVRGVRRWRRTSIARGALLGHGALRLLRAGVLLYGSFLLLWGLNYHRMPLAWHLGLETGAGTQEELAALIEELVVEANRLREELVSEDERGVVRLELSEAEVRRRVTERLDRSDVVGLPGPPPPLKFPRPASWFLTRSGISGVYTPWTGEPNVNAMIPGTSVPFTAAHEAAHAAGFAREDEANYLAYRLCRSSPGADFRYSAALAALRHTLAALAGADLERARALAATCSDAVKRDLQAVREFWQGHASGVTDLVGRMNDLYLKAHGQEDGTASYGRMVDLLLAERRRR